MPLHVVIAGSSGFLGSHLRSELLERGHAVTALVRRPAAERDEVDEVEWHPDRGSVEACGLPLELLERADVVINLAGSPTLGNPHSRRWARALRESRVTTTRLLAEAIATSSRPPAYLAGNGISWYGDHGRHPLTEASDSRGHALLTRVCRDWQEAAMPAVAAGSRVCWLRTAPVMDRRHPPLPQLRLLARAGLSARLGNGQQVMPMISRRDWVSAVTFLAEHPTLAGPVNLAAPRLPTNAEFTRALAEHEHRPALLIAPAPALKVMAGPMAPELLGSVDARPEALTQAGHTFPDPDVTAILATGLAR